MISGVDGITPVWQVEAPKYPRNKFCCLARGAQSPRCRSPGVLIGAAPGKTPPPQDFGLHRSSALEGLPGRKEVKVLQKKNKILDSSNHLLSPDSSSNIHPSPSRAGCRSSTRLPGQERAGQGRGQAGPGVWRSR